MKKSRIEAWGLAILLVSVCGAPAEAQLPTAPGICVLTRIESIGTRLVDGRTNQPIRGSGSAVTFANKGYQVSYEDEPAISSSRVGDRVYFCLMQIPRDCPPGDNRGKVYTTTNLRTLQSWTLPDSQHSCGGA